MLTPNVAGFFKKAQADSGLAGEMRNAGNYQGLAELPERAGEPASCARRLARATPGRRRRT
jgi:hypothetical protein